MRKRRRTRTDSTHAATGLRAQHIRRQRGRRTGNVAEQTREHKVPAHACRFHGQVTHSGRGARQSVVQQRKGASKRERFALQILEPGQEEQRDGGEQHDLLLRQRVVQHRVHLCAAHNAAQRNEKVPVGSNAQPGVKQRKRKPCPSGAQRTQNAGESGGIRTADRAKDRQSWRVQESNLGR